MMLNQTMAKMVPPSILCFLEDEEDRADGEDDVDVATVAVAASAASAPAIRKSTTAAILHRFDGQVSVSRGVVKGVSGLSCVW